MSDKSVQTHATQLAACTTDRRRAEALACAGRRHQLARSETSHTGRSLRARDDGSLRQYFACYRFDIGGIEPSELLARSGNIFSSRELADLAEAGTVGDVSLQFFDKNGGLVKTLLDGRVIALAGGARKTAAIAGVLRIGVIDMLATDKFTADQLISD